MIRSLKEAEKKRRDLELKLGRLIGVGSGQISEEFGEDVRRQAIEAIDAQDHFLEQTDPRYKKVKEKVRQQRRAELDYIASFE